MIKVWTDHLETGFLDRNYERGSTFSYWPTAMAGQAVSMTMPVRLPSWNTPYGLAPIFEMNLPEGALRERLRLTFAKATGSFDEFDLLSIIGRSQLGRLRFSGEKESLQEEVPFQSIDDILSQRRDGDLFRLLLDRFASFSGISGVQPKILIRDEKTSDPLTERRSASFRGATHIVKFWEPSEFPQLAANEYFCLQVARRCGLDIPQVRLANDGLALVIDRFDLRPDGSYRGFEDFCVLNARRTDEKYRGSYETSVLKRFQQFAQSSHIHEDMEKLYTLLILNFALRNGDAHLKNFGILYDDVLGEARLAPVYDVITTTAYLPADQLALTLQGTARWPTRKSLQPLGESYLGVSPSKVTGLFEKIHQSIRDTTHEVQSYIKNHPEFTAIGTSMIQEWEKGAGHTLR